MDRKLWDAQRRITPGLSACSRLRSDYRYRYAHPPEYDSNPSFCFWNFTGSRTGSARFYKCIICLYRSSLWPFSRVIMLYLCNQVVQIAFYIEDENVQYDELN